MSDKKKEYHEQFTEIKCVGKGNFGTVYLVKDIEDNKLYVAKKIALDALSEKEVEGAYNEVFSSP